MSQSPSHTDVDLPPAGNSNPGVYVRQGQRSQSDPDLDVLWAGGRSIQRDDKHPLLIFTGGILVGVFVTLAIVLLLNNRPNQVAIKQSQGANTLTAPIETTQPEVVPRLPDNQNAEITTPLEETLPTDRPELPATQQVQSTAASSASGSTSYVVQSGDTLETIARKVYGYGYPKYIEKIQRANGMDNPNRLRLNQKLVIPPKNY